MSIRETGGCDSCQGLLADLTGRAYAERVMMKSIGRLQRRIQKLREMARGIHRLLNAARMIAYEEGYRAGFNDAKKIAMQCGITIARKP